MCLILDTDIVHLVFPRPARNYVPVHEAITERRARIVYGGGRLLTEYQGMGEFWRLLYRLDQQGSARKVSDNKVDLETESVCESGLCRSNDQHIIGLARVSGARLLCTDDGSLMRDFTDPALISEPRGKVYKRPAHVDLIRQKCQHVWVAKKRRKKAR